MLTNLTNNLNKGWQRKAQKAVKYLQELLASGVNVDTAITKIQKRYPELFTLPELRPALVEAAAYAYGIVPEMLSTAQIKQMGEELSQAWDASGMKLSEKLHGVQSKMRGAIIDTVREQMRQNKKWQEAAKVLYDGYTDGNDIIRSQDMARYMQTVRHATGGDAQALRTQLKALDNINKLAGKGAPNKALKAAYNELLDKVQLGQEKQLAKAVEVAINEKSRYVAERITRTEMARAWADGFWAKAQNSTDIVAVKFKLSSRHPVFDICDMYSKADMFGLGAGVFPKNKVPALPIHPHCLCRYVEVYADEVDLNKQRDNIRASGDEWLENLSDLRKRQVLGYDGLKAWQNGEDWRKYMRGYAGFREIKSRLSESSYTYGVGSPKCDLKYIKSEEYKRKFDKLTDNKKLNQEVYKRCKAMVIHQSGGYFEDICILTADKGELVGLESSKTPNAVTYSEKLKENIKKYGKYKLISIHNHGTNLPPTGADFGTAGYRGYKFGVVACHNGRVFYYSVQNAKGFLATSYDKTVAKFIDKPYNLSEDEAIIKTLRQYAKDYNIEWKEL